MKHPNEGTLALHAGGDLGPFRRWLTERHLGRCERCREEMAAFEELRVELPELAELPDLPWNRMAADMKANIRLGLAAGECVRAASPPLREMPFFTRARAAVAVASVMVLVGTGLVLQRPAPLTATAGDHTLVRHMANGIQVERGGQAFRLLNAPDVKNVMFSVSAQGSMGARYVDPDTGGITINNVYAQ
jgi:hypothetical protein